MEIASQPGIRLETHESWHVLIAVSILRCTVRIRSPVACTHLRSGLTSAGEETSRPTDGLHEIAPSPLVAATNCEGGEEEVEH